MIKLSNQLLLPVLPLRDAIFFPGDNPPLFIGRKKSICALESSVNNDKKLLLIAQKDPLKNNVTQSDLYDVGVLSSIIQLLKLPDGAIKALVKIESRVKVLNCTEKESFLQASIEIIDDDNHQKCDLNKLEALKRSIISGFRNYIKLHQKSLTPEESEECDNQDFSYKRCADFISSRLEIKISEKQAILEIFDIEKRMKKIYSVLKSEIDVLNIERRIRHRVKSQIENTQKVYYLNEQIKAIQKELGNSENNSGAVIDDTKEFSDKIKNKHLSAEAKEKAKSEIKKLKMMSPMSAEATVIRNYLDCLLNMPWGKKTRIQKNIRKAAAILESNHYAMEKVKERIIEHLSVQKKTKELKGPILCLFGPPGVGKTSLAKSIATATGRKFVRMSLGGVRDESEIRGHRRTYIGSMPGKIIQSLEKVKSLNPLFLLDEVDKMGMDYRGDPASALLEVLDKEHNKHFVDHYLEVEYDLSHVMFICTANTLNIPRPLLDRMEIIHIHGYTEEEKIHIVNKHLIKKLKHEHGLSGKEMSVSREALCKLIRSYTRENGVRNLSRELANLMRKTVKEIITGEKKKVVITVNNLKKYSGVRKYSFGRAEEENLVGVIAGLAYTEVGGEIMSIESVMMPGTGNVKSTGKLGDVIQESVQAAYSYIRSRCLELGITSRKFKEYDIHIHFPEGATPKDGPSAGIAICSSIVSLLTGIPIDSSIAMTGEITLRGRVLEIGGLKEKLLAALRAGIKTVVIPYQNEKDLEEMPANIKKGLKIITVKHAEDAIKIALLYPPVPVEEDEEFDDKNRIISDRGGNDKDINRSVQH